MHPDSVEAINWGMLGGWINDKHPPLSGFLADFFFNTLGGEHDIAIYILAQICMIIAFIYIYRLGRLLFNDERKAIISAILLEGVLYYSMTASDQFNCNIVSIPLWAATAFYVYRAVKQGRSTDWIFVGVAFGLNMLDKYSAAFQLAGIGAYMLLSRDARVQLRRPWPYLGAIVSAAIFAPHVYALHSSNFVSLSYLSRNAIAASHWWMRWTEPLLFVLSLIAAAAAAIVIYFIGVRNAKRASSKDTDTELFLSCMLFAPIIAMILNSMISNLEMSTMWGIPFLFLVGTALVYFFPRAIGGKQFKRILIGCYIVMVIFAFINLSKYIFNSKHRIHFDRSLYVEEIGDRWTAKTNGAPLHFVRGDIWFTSILSVYHPQNPRTILNVDAYNRQELNTESMKKYGLLIVDDDLAGIIERQRELLVKLPIQQYNYKTQNLVGDAREYQMFYVIIPPRGDKNDKDI